MLKFFGAAAFLGAAGFLGEPASLAGLALAAVVGFAGVLAMVRFKECDRDEYVIRLSDMYTDRSI